VSCRYHIDSQSKHKHMITIMIIHVEYIHIYIYIEIYMYTSKYIIYIYILIQTGIFQRVLVMNRKDCAFFGSKHSHFFSWEDIIGTSWSNMV